MARVLLILIVVLATIYCVVEVAQADPLRVRRAPKWLWAAAVIALPIVGPAAWLILGRPVAGRRPPAPPRAPDDDPDFLRGL